MRRLRGEPVAIYGAGSTGALLGRSLRRSRRYRPVAFIDEDPGRTLARIDRRPVYPVQHLERALDRHRIRRVILALPSAGDEQRRRIVEQLLATGVAVDTVPAIDELLAGRRALTELEPATAASGVETVACPERLRSDLSGAHVAITGAGGSIGRELARQIARLGPGRLVLIERNERNLYELMQLLRSEAAREGRVLAIEAHLADAADAKRLCSLFEAAGVSRVYHAAAYKHVPLVESNPLAGAANNVLATAGCLEAAERAGVERFVLVSSDKAVRPTSVMGASKRAAELLVQAHAQRGSGLCAATVRFANVLDSSGSVLPLFREQIRHGGPLTVTHPEARRYFMTIPQAAGLLLQAGALAEGGEVFVLEPDDAVRIEDLARRLIALSGLRVRDTANPDGEIPIVYTGLREGEKLSEQLLLGEQVSGTGYPRILRAWEPSQSAQVLERGLEALEQAVAEGDGQRARAVLGELVPEYEPPGARPATIRRLQVVERAS
ncbi:SDR family NAD(P)-dependent oxidoreductase [Halorhodospira halochloris]|uniref:polysaccharide biosynthesis protein n=1 Tax=Halorhodospira halochloris TaxID=1052 RepID=UPI001EE8B9DB|nr:polysaccharide biosynthesis protein [Halorhodospira halochloris]MCG5531453.1 SDR family NAD(P)-dependent oxidoreductase [Halorhodospira halochloris]